MSLAILFVLFFYDLLAFHYQPAEALNMIRSYTHVGVTRHVSDRYEPDTCVAKAPDQVIYTCVAKVCTILLHNLLI